ncbi:CIC11C00000005541 [Sungouiella intermedia]|uniref:CIC11C00000005541 n=1 Tax=Sungouiella intermedia TaxID=45354 RepID=A0A1L0BIM4_9ASCO|nr:CIC11C00000005541 [[Candida] intermedia]
MAESDFPTTILTSKEPEDVANFLPHSLHLSSALIEKNLVAWFSNYSNMLIRYNQDLNLLVSKGRDFFEGTGGEFGSVDKIWNCVASNVMSQMAVNDLLIKAIRNDILTPFNAAFKTDFKYPELIVNSNELLEMQHHLGDSNGAYNWNVKAPAILSNFENYKRYEKDMLFAGFLSYLNTYNSKTSNVLSKNENAVNYILREFSVDSEMEKYTNYMILAKPPAATLPPPPPPPPAADKHSRHASSRASVVSTPSVLSGEKKKSKLRSKMGSILGRKKKNSPLKHSDTIPENHSLASAPSRQPSRQATSVSTSEPVTSGPGASASQNAYEPSRGLGIVNTTGVAAGVGAAVGAGAALAAGLATNSDQKSHDRRFSGFQGLDTKPLQPSQPDISSSSNGAGKEKDLPNPLVAQPDTKESPEIVQSNIGRSAEEDANLVKYTSSDEDSDVPTDRDGNAITLLQAHNLDHPPKLDKLDTDSDFRSRNTSSGKYSFEYGDEENSMSAMTPKSTAAPQFGLSAPSATQPEVSLPISNEIANAQATSPEPIVTPSANSSRPAPPPPPSRKVHNIVSDSHATTSQRDVSSHTQPNLSSARELFVQPHYTGGRASLISQTTGNSLFKQNDYFKHFGSTDGFVADGLNTSVAEIVNANFQSGKLTKAVVLGEIAFNYNSSEPLDSYDVFIPTKFTKFLLNDKLLQQTGEGLYKLDIPQIQSKTLGGVKYMKDLNQQDLPLLIKQVWRFEPHQASLIIKLSLNPSYNKSVEFENVAISATLDSSVTSTSASSKPEGTFNKDSNRISWKYTKPLVLSPQAPELKLIARILTDGEAKEAASGVQVKFSISSPPVPFTEILDSQGAAVPSVRSLSTGNYSSHM